MGEPEVWVGGGGDDYYCFVGRFDGDGGVLGRECIGEGGGIGG